jgi:hypothetical protein
MFEKNPSCIADTSLLKKFCFDVNENSALFSLLFFVMLPDDTCKSIWQRCEDGESIGLYWFSGEVDQALWAL